MHISHCFVTVQNRRERIPIQNLQLQSSVHKKELGESPLLMSPRCQSEPGAGNQCLGLCWKPEQCSQLGTSSLPFLAPAAAGCCQEETAWGSPAAWASEDQRRVLGGWMSVCSAFQNPTQGCHRAEPAGWGSWQVRPRSPETACGDRV